MPHDRSGEAGVLAVRRRMAGQRFLLRIQAMPPTDASAMPT